MLKRILILGLSFIGTYCLAQDPQFTQFYANPLYLNPAFAGSTRCPRVGLNYRNQWPSLNKAYITESASYDQHFDAIAWSEANAEHVGRKLASSHPEQRNQSRKGRRDSEVRRWRYSAKLRDV